MLATEYAKLTLDGDAFSIFEQLGVLRVFDGGVLGQAGHRGAVVGGVGFNGYFTDGSESPVSVSRIDVFASF